MDKYVIEIPELCVIALIGETSCEKIKFTFNNFKQTEVIFSDYSVFRGIVRNNRIGDCISEDSFDMIYHAAKKRLTNAEITVIDVNGYKKNIIGQIINIAREQNVPAVAIVLNRTGNAMQEQNIQCYGKNNFECDECKLYNNPNCFIKELKNAGFSLVYVINSYEQLENTEVLRTKLQCNKKDYHGPFDVIGDIHGCCDELEMLLVKLGYVRSISNIYSHPQGRKAVFIGDLCDRGPKNTDVLRLVMDMVKSGNAFAVQGNHDFKLLKYLRGEEMKKSVSHLKTIAEIEAMPEAFRRETESFLDGLASHLVFDDGKLITVHAGVKQEYIGFDSDRVREFCLKGEKGLCADLEWITDYNGNGIIVYGHITGKDVRVRNNTYCIDTACVYGGKLTAFRYPEIECTDVQAIRQYYKRRKPIE